ncbi:ABC transporter ATP-binding protein [Chitinimonas sp. BJYL2]|uniref:ABC transporter ATP-binding protein n=1 Tax=Chitinimonas sp. BJYL2 TaxID=2976696 RepID=UPI0022B4E310|nr:sn-glycerol-3-phosphate ABC transporter ATP-binding protein UgpC [Chitinimonas sp. BJYL2]
MASLSLQGVVKTFGSTTTIHGVDLHVHDGEFIVFVGPSGCGKSTLLRMIAGLEDISAGTLTMDGQDLTHAPPSARQVAMVFQSYALYPHMTVRDNLTFGMRMRGEPKAEIASKLDRAVRILRLEAYLDRKPGELSGGQCQRVAIGRALVQNPGLFLFDEPLSNLDAELRLRMRVEIAALHRELGTTMIYVTHDQVEAMTLADRIVVLRDGRIEQVGAPMDLYRQPANAFVAGFIGSPAMNFLPASWQAAPAQVQLGDGTTLGFTPLATVQGSGQGQLGIRPEHLQRDPEGPLVVTVEMVERLGALNYAYARLGNSALCFALADSDVVTAGDTVRLSARPGCVYVFDDAGQTLSDHAA